MFVAVSGYLLYQPAYGQGSIFGFVTNSNLTIPDSGQIQFFGYLNGTDDEIRSGNCVGAGFDGGYWFDDFQNFMGASAGNPYNYHFFNTANLEGFVLSDIIPDNSFQQEDIQLESMVWPPAPAGLAGQAEDDSTVYIHWTPRENTTYRIYRRAQPSEGSFFRIDNPTGSLSDPGVADSFYIDSQVDNASFYDYILIPVEAGVMGAPSEILTIDSNPWLYICGDSDRNGIVNLMDGLYVIKYLYRMGPEPMPLEAAEVDGNHILNIMDVTYLIKYLYKGGAPLICAD